jgi:hypothetical protein
MLCIVVRLFIFVIMKGEALSLIRSISDLVGRLLTRLGQSYIPKYIRYDDLPSILCYEDIDLFVVRNPEGGSDVIITVINFRNLKGTE